MQEYLYSYHHKYTSFYFCNSMTLPTVAHHGIHLPVFFFLCDDVDVFFAQSQVDERDDREPFAAICSSKQRFCAAIKLPLDMEN